MATMAQALRLAIHFAEENLELRDVFGQDVGAPLGGVFTVTQGVKSAWNSPLDERGILGMATGIALTGQRCLAEIQFCDYIFNGIDHLKLMGGLHWSCGGRFSLPLVVMTPVGAGIHGSIYHSHSFDSWATRLPGWKIVMPSDPKDAYGLMLSAIVDPNPVLFLVPKALMRERGRDLIPGEPSDEKVLKKAIDAPLGDLRKGWLPQWPQVQDYRVPIGPARLVREGERLTLVTWGRHVSLCLKAADELFSKGFSIEVVDLRSLAPYDWTTIKQSIEKTGRFVVVNEDTEVTNFGEHLVYRALRELFYQLQSRPLVVAGKHIPGVGLHPNLEEASVPQLKDIVSECVKMLEEEP